MALLFISWWYGEQFKNVLNYIRSFLLYLFDFFSVRICVSTLFSVWRRDKISFDGLSLPRIIEAILLNFASRLVGFVVKTFTLAAYISASILFAAVFCVFVFIWLTFPIFIAAMIFYGILNILNV